MKFLFLILLLVPATVFSHDERFGLPEFLLAATGTFELIEREGSPEKCPTSFKTRVVNDDTLQVINVLRTEPEQRKLFKKIDKTYQREERERFENSYLDRLAKLYRYTVTSYGRICDGFREIKCGPWVMNSSFTLTGTGAKVKVNASANFADLSGFPAGTCQYLKIAR